MKKAANFMVDSQGTRLNDSSVVIAMDILRRINEGAMVSYAQNYEDVILRRVFPDPYVGCFVDIGAFDPVKNSVTHHFHLRGWHGVNIDADKDNISKFEKSRPHETNVWVKVGAADGSSQIYSIPNTSRSTSLDDLASSYRERGMSVQKASVPTTRLSTLLSELNLDSIDFLKIDVEGSEADVIAGGDWSRHRPRIVIAEATYPETPDPNWASWEPLLLESGYSFAYFDGLNRFYVREEDAGLISKLNCPPNFFDNFVRIDAVQLAKEVLSRAQQQEDG